MQLCQRASVNQRIDLENGPLAIERGCQVAEKTSE